MRVTVFDESSFSELRVFRGSPREWLVWVLVVLGLVAVVTYGLVALTPLKKWLVPDFVSLESRLEISQTHALADSLETMLARQERVVLALRHAMVGDSAAMAFLAGSSDDLEIDGGVGDGLEPHHLQPSSAEQALREVVGLEDRFVLQRQPDALSGNQMGFTYPPVIGAISDDLQVGLGHLGVDLVAPNGSPVQAVDDGSVLFSTYTVSAGYTILVQHRGERVSVYKHCASLLKQQGDLVAGGETIALVGNTGELTDGPHLHFEWWVRGRALDPLPWLGLTRGQPNQSGQPG